jgi:transcription elongation factor S-II
MAMRKVENPDIFRKNICVKLNEILQDEKKSKNMERGVYNYTLKESTNRKVVKKWDNPYFMQIYIDRMRSIYINLKNVDLLEQIKNETIKSQNVAFMTHQEMKPEKWETMIQEKIKRDKNKFETTIEAATDTFKCRKCHSNKCTYYQMQTRSADEPMTTFVTCIECGNRWKC